jgi:hypothetical protein
MPYLPGAQSLLRPSLRCEGLNLLVRDGRDGRALAKKMERGNAVGKSEMRLNALGRRAAHVERGAVSQNSLSIVRRSLNQNAKPKGFLIDKDIGHSGGYTENSFSRQLGTIV